MNNPTFAQITCQNAQITCQNAGSSEPQIFKIIPPFSKETIKNQKRLNESYQACVNSILTYFPAEIQSKITITKTLTLVYPNKRLHSLTIIAPPEAKPIYSSMRVKGIPMMKKTIFPIGHKALNPNDSFYPRKVKIKLSNLPFICNDSQAIKLMALPPNIAIAPKIHRFTEKLANGTFYNGLAVLETTVNNKEQEDLLRNWSFNARTAYGSEWNGIPISFHTPSLHECEKCKNLNRLHVGHHQDWCLIPSETQNVTQNEASQNSISTPSPHEECFPAPLANKDTSEVHIANIPQPDNNSPINPCTSSENTSSTYDIERPLNIDLNRDEVLTNAHFEKIPDESMDEDKHSSYEKETIPDRNSDEDDLTTLILEGTCPTLPTTHTKKRFEQKAKTPSRTCSPKRPRDESPSHFSTLYYKNSKMRKPRKSRTPDYLRKLPPDRDNPSFFLSQ